MAERPRPGLQYLTPAAQLRADRLPRRLVQLFVGLSLFGASLAMMVRGALGLAPWDVLHLGVAQQVDLSLGTVVVLTSLVLLLLWIPLREMPGLGTIANAVWVGVALDLTLPVLPDTENLPVRIALMVGGVVLNGLAGALYIGAQLGPGPRDGLMTGLARRTGRSLRVVRTSIEVTVLGLGWLLGGVVGVGTLLYAAGVGPLVQLFLPYTVVRVTPRRSDRPR
ncbi:hypothetical protein PU560_14380 [Georgenia sp. 10Sc9-8]|uniref:YitT family protein n=1 Tax=Georgenia halotolerans TaxID=3028317 RepID=A0ABT5U3C6_9MICO|nr:hypothetical protein [Georgenia halotolerans]